MNLLVIRHAISEDRNPNDDDAGRQLTSSGERKFRGVVRGLRALGWRLDRTLTSPWVRAARTADLLEPIAEGDPIATDLLCQSPRAELLAMIAETRAGALKRHAVAVVGHEPWLGELVAWLAFGDTRHGEALELKKGGVTWLEGSSTPGGMTVRAILPPRVTRQL